MIGKLVEEIKEIRRIMLRFRGIEMLEEFYEEIKGNIKILKKLRDGIKAAVPSEPIRSAYFTEGVISLSISLSLPSLLISAPSTMFPVTIKFFGEQAKRDKIKNNIETLFTIPTILLHSNFQY